MKIKILSAVWWLLLIALVIFGKTIYDSYPSLDQVLNFEFASSLEYFNNLQQTCKCTDEQRDLLEEDTIFIGLYTVLFAIGTWIIFVRVQQKMPWWMLLVCLIPGSFDLVENYYLNTLFLGATDLKDFNRMSLFVNIKWGTSIVFIVGNIFILIYHIIYFINVIASKILQGVKKVIGLLKPLLSTKTINQES